MEKGSLLQTIETLLQDPTAQNLRRLFCETLHWNHSEAPPLTPYRCEPLAELAGVRVFLCTWNAERLPNRTERKQVYQHLAPLATEHLLVYRTADGGQLAFVWARRTASGTPEFRSLPYERGTPARTTLEQLSELLFPLDTEPTLIQVIQQIDRAFDVEAVTQRFFQEYKQHFERVVEVLKPALPDEKARTLFTLRIFNRLLFLRFLERKGWLRLNNRTDYLRALWDAYTPSPETDFYRERLKPLFFSALNNPQQRNLTAINQGGHLHQLLGEVPYLNGGLFEMTELDKNPQLTLPDALFESVLNQLLTRYNFTITESTPLDLEVAVDPEMLGKVFEELVTGRHESGSFYTPRPVVAFMGQEALLGYLQSACPRETPDALHRFVKERDPSHLHDPEQVLEALKRVRVCDPACGSGAYLMGMLHELLELRTALFQTHQLDDATAYTRKLEIIQNNLYGVDLDPFAVEMTRLRLWLSLVVDDRRNPLEDPTIEVALPNLDFKIEEGDSLLAPDPQGGPQPDLFRQQQIETYEQLKEQYLRAHSPEQKRQLREQIDQLRAEIRQWAHPSGQIAGFDWRVEFAEVFAEGGFDIVLANPPYVRQELIPNKSLLLAQYPDVAVGRSDLYVYFYARALQLLKPGGMHVFVCSNSWLDVSFGGKLQAYLLNHAHLMALYDSALERQFASADVNTIISVLRKGKPSDEAETRFIRLNAPFEEALRDPKHQRVLVKTRAELWQEGLGEDGQTYEGNKWGGKYLRAPDIFFTILEKGKGKLVRLGDIAEVRFGIKTGANEFFYLEPVEMTVKQVAELREKDPHAPVRVKNGAGWAGEIEAGWLRPVVKSPREIKTLQVRLEDLRYLVFMAPQDVRTAIEKGAKRPYSHYPLAEKYIGWGVEQGYSERSTCTSRQLWWDLGEKQAPPIVINKGANDRHFVTLNCGVVCDQQIYEVYSELDPVLVVALLNWTGTGIYWEQVGRGNFGEGVLWIAAYEVTSIAIPFLNGKQSATLISAFRHLSQRPILSIFEELGLPKPNRDYSNIDPAEISLDKVLPDRRALDQVVFEALGLTEEEQLAVYRAVVELVKA
ncbi:MAG: DNA methyltransferase, partial [Fimbriimonadales bacterium]